MTNTAALQIEGISVWRGRSEIVRSVDLTIPDGALVALVGSNGVGKTTLIEGILGVLPSRAKHIEFMGKTMPSRKPWNLVRSGFVVVPQDRHLFKEMTVAENIEIVPKHKPEKGRHEFSHEEIYALFPRLAERTDQLAGTLSGGERSMLAIARGLALSPRLLVLDEPSLGLSPLMVELIFEKIREISELGVSILLVEQNVHQALAISSFTQVLDAGETVAVGPSSELANSPLLESGFFGLPNEEKADD